jgi:hypothetical protein
LFLATLVGVVLGGLVAAIVLTRGSAEGAFSKGPPGILARGQFRALGWGTDGTASIVRDTSGTLKLRFSRNFNTQRAPELYVYFVKYVDGRRTDPEEVAPLQRARGSQEYALHATNASTLHAAVEIYCGECGKPFGVAQLKPTGQPHA